jgi:hypothetical protein
MYGFNEDLLSSIVSALHETFPYLSVYTSSHGDLIIVASRTPNNRVSGDVFKMDGVASSLHRLEIDRIEDLAVRRVADERVLASMLRTNGTAPNSDYFPIVDANAGRLRFLVSDANELKEIATAPWPIIDLLSKSPVPTYPLTPARWRSAERVLEAQRAERVRAFLMADRPDESTIQDLEGYTRLVSVLRSRLIDCHSGVAAEQWRDAMIATANFISSYLSPAASDAVWARMQVAPCHRSLDATTREWIALFRAVGQRDAESMARMGQHMLDAQVNPPLGEFEYVYGATMTALISLGRLDEARTLFDRNHARLPAPRQKVGWFRWMRSAIEPQ